MARADTPTAVIWSCLLAIVLLVAQAGTALAVKPEAKFKGDIVISKKRFPSRFDSDAKFIRHMKKVDTDELVADGDADWTFEYMAFLPRPVSTLKAAVTYFDITNPGQKKMVNTFSFYPNDRTERILAGHAELTDKKFHANHKYLMVFSRGYGQKAIATTQFVLQRTGQTKKSDSGVVDFTEDGNEDKGK